MNLKIYYQILPLLFLYSFNGIHFNSKTIFNQHCSTNVNSKESRVSYIYLDGSLKSIEEIDKLRNTIIKEYKKGVSFSELAKQYSMDGNSENGGDLGWFKENTMLPEFESAIFKHKKGDIFIIDIPLNNWYYVVLKTFEDRE